MHSDAIASASLTCRASGRAMVFLWGPEPRQEHSCTAQVKERGVQVPRRRGVAAPYSRVYDSYRRTSLACPHKILRAVPPSGTYTPDILRTRPTVLTAMFRSRNSERCRM